MERFALEGVFEGHLIQISCNKQDDLQLDQVSQSSAQSELNVSRDGVWNALLVSHLTPPSFSSNP